jgi:glycosyltransferase involved in cell wall biosynthesis
MEARRSDFFLAWNGFQYNITGAVEDYLVGQNYSVCSFTFPLFEREGKSWRIRFRQADNVSERLKRSMLKIPFSYLLDPIRLICSPKAKVGLSFSPHTTFAMLILKKLRRIEVVVQWNIDFSPRRFKNPLLNSIYNNLDRVGFHFSDIQIDLNSKALQARFERHGEQNSNRHLVLPVGIRSELISSIPRNNFNSKSICFLGNLTSTVGADLFVSSIPDVIRVHPDAVFHVIGDGPEIENLKFLANSIDCERYLVWHGNQDEVGINRILVGGCLAIAPYPKMSHSFSNYSDPSKIKNYLQFGLPILTTNVTPISESLFKAGLALEVSPSSEDIARVILEVLSDYEKWDLMRAASIEFAKEFAWDRILGELIRNIDEVRLHAR